MNEINVGKDKKSDKKEEVTYYEPKKRVKSYVVQTP